MKRLSLLFLLMALASPTPRAGGPLPWFGGEGGWINVPGGGGGTRPMLCVKSFAFEQELYFLLLDPVTPSMVVAPNSMVASWATGLQYLVGPETLEFKYNTRVNGVVGEIVVKVDCKNMTPQECAAKLARLTIATQKEFPPVASTH